MPGVYGAEKNNTLSLQDAGIHRIAYSYNELASDDTAGQAAHIAAMEAKLLKEIGAYGAAMSDPEVAKNPYHIAAYDAAERFDDVLRRVETVDLPVERRAVLMQQFLNLALNYDIDLTPGHRDAAQRIGLSIAAQEPDLQAMRIGLLLTHVKESTEYSDANRAQALRQQHAKDILSTMNVSVDIVDTQSGVDKAKEYAQRNAKAATITATTMGLVGVVLASPLSAAAAETKPTISTTITSEQVIPADTTTNTTEKDTSKLMSVVIAAPEKSSPTVTTASTHESAPASDLMSVNIAAPTASSAVKTVEVVAATKQPEVANIVAIAAPTESSKKSVDVPVSSSTDAETESKTTEKTNTSVELTPAQQEVAAIQSAINVDGNMSRAASLIRLGFHGQGDIIPGNKSTDASLVTNNDLVKSVYLLEAKLSATVGAKGHADTDYVNRSEMALAVLDAASNDQTILESKDIQALIKDAGRPSDPYKAKIYDQYLATATDILTKETPVVDANGNPVVDNNGKQLTSTLLDNFQKTNVDQIKQLYAYSLMAADSDATQADKIQAIKDAEQKAADEKKQAEQQKSTETKNTSYTETAQQEALDQLIKNAKSQLEKNGYTILQTILNDKTHSYTDYQAAGILGNGMWESANTLDPNIDQYHGPASGIWQWEGGRLVALKQKPNWRTIDVQTENVLDELSTTHSYAGGKIKSATNLKDAVRAFMYYFEVPRDYLDAKATGNWTKAEAQVTGRTKLAQPYLDSLQSTTKNIQTARDNAEAAAKKAAEEKAATIAAQKKADEQQKQQQEQQQKSPGDKIATMALSELAEWERGEDRPLDDQTTGTRSYLTEYSGGVSTHWCAYFVNTVLKQAGEGVEPVAGESIGVVNGMKQALQASGNYTWHATSSGYTPKAGDIAFYGNNDSDGMSHINIVISGASTLNYVSVGGNQGNSNAPAYAASYGGQASTAVPGADTYNRSYVTQFSGVSNFGEPLVGFMSHN